MSLFGKRNPDWLSQTREFCKQAGIKIMAWGPNLLTVEAKTPEDASRIAAQLAQIGFKVVESEGNADADMLDLSLDPKALQFKERIPK